MNFSLRDKWYVQSPTQALAVAVTLISQTDDDWFKLEIVPVDEMGQFGPSSYSLKLSRMPRNIGEVKFSQNGLVIAALEHDGSVNIWTRGEGEKFDTIGQIIYVGQPTYGLEIDADGDRLKVCVHPNGIRTWVRKMKQFVAVTDIKASA